MNADYTEEPPMGEELRARHHGRRIERLYALITSDGTGEEGMVRRNTPAGGQPMITTDPVVAETLLTYVRAYHFPNARIVCFDRAP